MCSSWCIWTCPSCRAAIPANLPSRGRHYFPQSCNFKVVERRASVTAGDMYSDHVAGVGNIRKRSIRDRLGENGAEHVLAGGRQNLVKRQRPDEGKWKHDLFQEAEERLQPTNGRLGANDLRFRLARQNTASKVGTGQISSVTGPREKDLREKLSGGTQSQAVPAAERRLASVVRGSSGTPATVAPQQVAVRSNTSQKPAEEQTVASLLQSLGLSKYLVTFQSEEVDMAALRHMSDDDLKELGVPMGPRRKILLATGAH